MLKAEQDSLQESFQEFKKRPRQQVTMTENKTKASKIPPRRHETKTESQDHTTRQIYNSVLQYNDLCSRHTSMCNCASTEGKQSTDVHLKRTAGAALPYSDESSYICSV